MSVLGLKSGYTVKHVPWAQGHILPYIPPLVLIRIQYVGVQLSIYIISILLEVLSSGNIILFSCSIIKSVKDIQ